MMVASGKDRGKGEEKERKEWGQEVLSPVDGSLSSLESLRVFYQSKRPSYWARSIYRSERLAGPEVSMLMSTMWENRCRPPALAIPPLDVDSRIRVHM